MKKCLNCGKENPDTSKFCGYCGTPLPMQAGPVSPPPPSPPAGVPLQEAGTPPTYPSTYPTPPQGVEGVRLPREAYPPSPQAYPPQAAPAQPQPPAAQGGYPQPPAAQGGYPPPPIQPRGDYVYPERPLPPGAPPPIRPGGQAVRAPYPPPSRPPRTAGAPAPDKSAQQRIIIIAVILVVLIGMILCAVIGWTQKDNIAGLINPEVRETQMAKDIEIGLTQTASVSIDVPATVQAQIAMTQAAASGESQPAPAEAQAAAPADENTYVTTVKQQVPQYAQAMSKIQELLTAASSDPNKLKDDQWKNDFTAATSMVTQTSNTLRQISAPSKYQEAHQTLLDAAQKLDSAVQQLTEYITSFDQAKLEQATKDRDEGSSLLKTYMEKVDQLSAQ